MPSFVSGERVVYVLEIKQGGATETRRLDARVLSFPGRHTVQLEISTPNGNAWRCVVSRRALERPKKRVT